VQLRGTSDLFQELEEATSAEEDERLRQIYEGEKERLVLFLSFLLWLVFTKTIIVHLGVGEMGGYLTCRFLTIHLYLSE